MLKMALRSPGKGPTGIIGITEENVKRMRAGMPLDINLKEITPPGDPRMKRVVIHLADTYEHVVDDMEKDGLPVTNALREQARALDTEMAREQSEPDAS